jgi:hypothetical protein
MAYAHINKQTSEVRTFGSVKSLSNTLKIPIDNLYTIFSRKKLKEHETNDYRIIKTKIERA